MKATTGTYCTLVAQVESALGSAKKLALDLATLLDHPLSQMTEKDGRWNGPHGARQRLFDLFCSVLTKAGCELPPLEECLWRADLPVSWSKPEERERQSRELQARLAEYVADKQGEAADQVRSLVKTMVMLTSLAGDSFSTNKNGLTAMISKLMVEELNLEPLRPDYTKVEVKLPVFSNGPSTPTKVLIVDDGIDELFSSAQALAGIPNVTVELFLYDRGSRFSELQGPELEQELAASTEKILTLEPQVVLMDQGLIRIKGSDLVRAIRSTANGNCPIFVANTGGDPKELRQAGCYGNFDKGRSPQGISEALSL